MTISDEAVEAAARAMAILKDEDGCFLEVDAWNALEEWEREAHPENYPGADIEDCAYWLEKARAALEAAAPFIRAGALEDVADLLDQPYTLWHGDGGVTVAGPPNSPHRTTKLTAWLRARAAAERENVNHD